jgi:hypothetical protein
LKDIRQKILDAIQDDNPEYKKLLKQTDINFCYYDESALIGAVSCENEKIINELVLLGANVNLVANQLTALSHAAQAGLPEICKCLLSHGSKLELGHTHPVLLLIHNYDNLDNTEKALETLHILLPHTDNKLYEDIMTHVYTNDHLDLFRYLVMESCIPVQKRNDISNDLLSKYNCAPTIREFLKSKQFFDSLDKQLIEKNKTLSKVIKI